MNDEYIYIFISFMLSILIVYYIMAINSSLLIVKELLILLHNFCISILAYIHNSCAHILFYILYHFYLCKIYYNAIYILCIMLYENNIVQHVLNTDLKLDLQS